MAVKLQTVKQALRVSAECVCVGSSAGSSKDGSVAGFRVAFSSHTGN